MADLPNLAIVDYVDRVNRAVDHVLRHLDEPLPLEEVARAACFSPFHFHRIFRSLMGETLAAFVKRVRLERAMYLLSHRKGASLTEIALACGFSSSSDFSRSFRSHYGLPPSVFDVEGFRVSNREVWQEYKLTRLPAGENPDGFKITLRKLPARRVAYIRVSKAYGGGVAQVAEQLVAWAEARGFADGQWLGYQWDDPEIVARDRIRYDVGVEVPRDTASDGIVSVTDFAPMIVAELGVAGSIELELRALDWLYLTWLPASGYAPAHEPVFEAWKGRPFAHGVEHFELKVQLAVVGGRVPL